MDPVTLGIGGALTLLGLGWGWLRRRSSKVRRVDSWLQQAKAYARTIWKGAEYLAAAGQLVPGRVAGGATKLQHYMGRVRDFYDRSPLQPVPLSQLERHAAAWATEWSAAAKGDLPHLAALAKLRERVGGS